jgi:protease IV
MRPEIIAILPEYRLSEELEAKAREDFFASVEPVAANEVMQYVKAGYPMQVADGVAVMRIKGAIWPFMASEYGGMIRAILTDKSITASVIAMDSPGGAVGAMFDIGDELQALSSEKPTVTHVAGMAASAGYYLAAKTNKVFASKYGQVGSLGVYAVLYDESEAFEKQGVKPVLIRNEGATVKGADAPGLPVTKEVKEEAQKRVDNYFGLFAEGIAQGRNMPIPSIQKLATGAMWPAGEAMSLGLVDSIGTLQDAVASVRSTYDRRKETNSLKTRALKARAQNI